LLQVVNAVLDVPVVAAADGMKEILPATGKEKAAGVSGISGGGNSNTPTEAGVTK
jgi:hypothetical protein